MSAKGKEAELREVLAEVSLLDLARVLKATLASWGCLLVILVFAPVWDWAFGRVTSSWSIPLWLIWTLILWGALAAATEYKSYHEFGFYFPKLRWWASLLLAAYVVGFVELCSRSWGKGGIIGMVAYLLYLFPFLTFMSAIEIGHNNLMRKREAEAQSSSASAATEAWQ